VSAAVNALRLAFGLLTAVPVGRLPRVDRRAAGYAVLLAPLTAAPLLLALAGAHVAASAGAPPLLLAAMVVATGALLSRALHLDGLADTADGLSAGYDAESSLRAMKASDTGPSGVAAVVLALLLQVGSLAALLPTAAGTALAVAAWLASRHSVAWACRRGVPAAQDSGLGALVAGSVSRGALAVATALVVASAFLVSLVVAPQDRPLLWGVPLVLGSGLGAAGWLTRRCGRRLGGITGDVLGAGVEVSLTAALTTAALLVSF
jgi:adenosylcobinamide-GDP ribazoletransferase